MKRNTARAALASLFLLAAASAASVESPLSGARLRAGCNYWASHAGMMMWRNWDAAQVEKDFAALSSHGISVMRVFPLWPDFQPLTAQYGGGGAFRRWAQKDGPLLNPAAVDPEMMARFRKMCDVAQKHEVKLVVGLVTGWMSGRLFVPPALERKNAITDPEARMWQVRFVRHFVREMKDHPAIAAWDLGNECNCMGPAEVAEAWNWLNAIGSAIRLEDASRPVVSGMHSLHANAASPWNLRHQGELMDVLTTHPYPLWTPNMNREPFNTLRNGLHASAESLMYAGVSGKPCFAEEAGDMGRNVCSEERAAANVRNALFTAWANGLGAYVWWCAFDQGKLRFPPYTWTAVECDLGLMRDPSTPKPQLLEIKRFTDFMRTFPHADLPPRRVDAVCLVNEAEDSMPPSMGAFMLSRQAGFDISFCGAEGKLPDASFYIMPSGRTMNPYSGDAWYAVLGKVRAGATLLLTRGGEMAVSDFLETTGNDTDYTTKEGRSFSFSFPGGPKITAPCPTTRVIAPRTSKVLASTPSGEAVMTVNAYGKGKIVYVNYAVECESFLRSGAYHPVSNPHWLVYRKAAEIAGVKRKVRKGADGVNLGLTEHALPDGSTLVVAVNYEPRKLVCALETDSPVEKVWLGEFSGGKLSLGPNSAAILKISAAKP